MIDDLRQVWHTIDCHSTSSAGIPWQHGVATNDKVACKLPAQATANIHSRSGLMFKIRRCNRPRPCHGAEAAGDAAHAIRSRSGKPNPKERLIREPVREKDCFFFLLENKEYNQNR